MERWGLSRYNELERREHSLVIKLNEPEVDVYLLTFIDKHFTI